ncbi:conserved hypothetical protein [Flavobacterium sp. 9AF]|uniref:antibiotic biosynthesis monooxygenase family protein n=1 Tax=Flavobacterium sp. 9AF TaxID=2653142 RepID=UPI0012F0C150|nr:antibiotic biosynthesis monooxygenase [Flavobacterium sp. 9AF]VXB59670.1 conserved hypothetical protein [Flavobacterium sp. 9AF]
MIVVLFEAFPVDNKWEEYLDLATELKPELIKIEGFIAIERFKSVSNPNKILSLSFWKDEASIQKWRTLELHREVQKKGRNSIFNDYQIRVATVIRDYSMNLREQSPEDSKLVHRLKK